jgi:hypothetical protein
MKTTVDDILLVAELPTRDYLQPAYDSVDTLGHHYLIQHHNDSTVYTDLDKFQASKG